MAALGHEVRLIAPQCVRPFVKRQCEAEQKTIRWIVFPPNDAADAGAVVAAAQRPGMRFVTPGTADQQAHAALFRRRERLVHQRAGLANALRAVLCEYGHTVRRDVGRLVSRYVV